LAKSLFAANPLNREARKDREEAYLNLAFFAMNFDGNAKTYQF
jgi:hypothetical protein